MYKKVMLLLVFMLCIQPRMMAMSPYSIEYDPCMMHSNLDLFVKHFPAECQDTKLIQGALCMATVFALHTCGITKKPTYMLLVGASMQAASKAIHALSSLSD